MERKAWAEFHQYWDRLFKVFPEYRRTAVEAMGEAARKNVRAQIQAADLESDAKGHVDSWQELAIGSKGGYAAVRPKSKTPYSGERPKTWKGVPVTVGQVTVWLERGHGTAGIKTFHTAGRGGTLRTVSVRAGEGYVKGRQFYSRARSQALPLALKAADECLSKIEDELEYD